MTTGGNEERETASAAQEGLRRTEQYWWAMLNAITEPAYLLDANGRFLAANSVGARRFWKRPEELIGLCAYDLFPPNVARKRRAKVEEVVRTGLPAFFQDEREGRVMDNTYYPALDDQGRVMAVAVFARDITEQKRSEEALARSEERYRTLAEASPDMIFVIGPDDRVAYVNGLAAQFVGKKPEDVVGQPRASLFPPPIAERQGRSLRQLFETGQPRVSEIEEQSPDRQAWLSTWLVPLKDGGGQVNAVLGVARDVTRSKQVEMALRQSQAHLQFLMTASPAVIYSFKAQKHSSGITFQGANFISGNLKAILGYETEELLNNPAGWFELVHPEDREIILNGNQVLYDRGSLVIEYRFRHKNGAYRWLHDEMKLQYRSENGFWEAVGAWFDVTERKGMQEALRETNQQLREERDKVKTLQKLVPICSYCKDIRDDQGFWQQVELYVREHTGAEFSHGICPECLRIHHPEVYEDMRINGQTE
jgi:PAS domain S-box-containing protein